MLILFLKTPKLFIYSSEIQNVITCYADFTDVLEPSEEGVAMKSVQNSVGK